VSGNVSRDELKRILAGTALPQKSGQLTTYNPVGQAHAAVAAARPKAQADDLDARIQANHGTAPKHGHKGVLGTLLNNPVGHLVTEGMRVLDSGRAYTVSGVKELTDLGDALAGKLGFDMSTDDHSPASFKEFLQQGRDHIGFGDVLHAESRHARENKWVGRIGGLAGDIALDPLTYTTLGAGHFAGQSGRLAAAEKLSKAGMHEAAAKVARLGVNAADEAERKVIFAGLKDAEQLAKPGVRIMGQRVAATGKLADVVGEGLSRTRAAVADALPDAVRNIRAPKGLEEAYKAFREGRATPEDFELVAHDRTLAKARERFSATYSNTADKIAHDIHKAGAAADEEAFRQLDEGLAHGPLAQQAKQLFDDVHTDASKTVTELGHREDYAPHIFTQEGRKALKGDAFADVRRQIGMDVTEATGGAVKRTIHPGTKLTMPDGQVVEFVADTAHGAVSARQINEKLGQALGVKKVVEDRLSQTLKPYVTGIAESVGRAEADRNIGAFTELGGMVDAVDKEATVARAKKVAKEIAKEAKDEGKVDQKLVRDLNATGTKAKKAAVAQLEKNVTSTQADLAAAKAAEARAAKVIPALEQQRNLVTKQTESAVSAHQAALDKIAAEQTALHESTVSERAAIDDAKRQAHLERDAANKRDVRARGNGVEGPIRSGSVPETEAAKEAHAALDQHVARVQADIDRRRDMHLAGMSEAERKAQRSYDQLDAARQAAVTHRMNARDYQAMAQRDIKVAKEQLAKAKRINPTPSKGTAAAYNAVHHDLDTVLKWADSPATRETRAQLTTYAKQVAELRDGQTMQKALRDMEKAVKSGDIAPVMKKVIQDGYEQLGASLIGPDAPIVKQELARRLKNLNKAFDDPGFWGKAIDKYTQFFKTYATATVGFHVRNAMTAAFNNAVDGVSVHNMIRGADLWETFARNPREFEMHIPEWITPEQAHDALDAVFASGGGSGQYGKAELIRGKSKITNNAFTRASARIGGKVEGFARMGMAVDSILNGASMEEAAARISRIHFNYSQVSKFDSTMKRIIPFWTFTSRNVPMQIQQMFLKPKLYQWYSSLARNMGQDYQNDMVPLSWQEAGAFKITDGVYLAPDLAHLRLESDIGKLTTDPQRLLSEANPLMKIPFETLIAKRKLFTDTPFKDGAVESVSGGGLEALAPVLDALGLTKTAGDGTKVVDEKLAYALRGLIPPLAQTQRLTGDDPYYSDKRSQSVANYFGLPIRQLTPGQKKAEADRRAREAKKAGKKTPQEAALAAFHG
jgi:hypothetical protein